MKNKIVTFVLLSAFIISLTFADAVTAAGNAQISGYIWEDIDGNGMHEPDEEATINGVTINILTPSGGLENSVVTANGGSFTLSLSAGDHVLQVIMPDVYRNYSSIRAADFVHGVLERNGNTSNEFVFNAESDRRYIINIAASWESKVIDTPDDNNDNTDGDNGEDENETPSPTPDNGDDVTVTPSESPSASPDADATARPTANPTARPTARPTAKPSDGGAGGAAGGEVQKQEKDVTPSPSPAASAMPTASPEVQVKPELNKIDHMAYVAGYPDGTVMPESNITRQEVAALFYRLLTDESQNYFYSNENGFADVQPSLWSNEAISAMSKAGILSGYSSGMFLPENNITRAEFATVAAKLDSGSYSGSDRFADISGHWASPYINRAAQLGWISGYDGGVFKPDAYITRAEAMTIINNILARHVEPEDMLVIMRRWTDNTPDKWYYSAVQEATNSHYYEKADDGYYEVWTELR